MPLIHYKTGVASGGYEEWTNEYFCDAEGCENVADYGKFCEEHDDRSREDPDGASDARHQDG
jgi:hypothetical protein